MKQFGDLFGSISSSNMGRTSRSSALVITGDSYMWFSETLFTNDGGAFASVIATKSWLCHRLESL